MKITYYGTGDGYGIPEPFCSCRLCSYARAHGGKDIRTRSQATVDDIMIDCSSDMFAHQAFYGLDMRKYRPYPDYARAFGSLCRLGDDRPLSGSRYLAFVHAARAG